MKVLYVGSLSEYGNCYERLEAFREIGHLVVPIDTYPKSIWRKQRRFINRVAWTIGFPADLARVNEQMFSAARDEKPDVIWVDKGVMVSCVTLARIRENVRDVTIAHFNPDDPFGPGWQRGWRTFLKAVPQYDVHFVSRRQNVIEYKHMGARRVVHDLPGWGYHPSIHKPYSADSITQRELGCDVAFIGGFEVPRAETLLDVARAGISARVWGPWPKKYWHHNLQVEYAGIYKERYGLAIACSKIALCFLRKKNRDQHTVRSVEIPACGTFMLAERTSDHMALFEEGKEAEFFSTSEELIDKIRFYLKDESARARIARAGRERCLRSGYSNHELMTRRISALTRHAANGDD